MYSFLPGGRRTGAPRQWRRCHELKVGTPSQELSCSALPPQLGELSTSEARRSSARHPVRCAGKQRGGAFGVPSFVEQVLV